jgi:hypothetical protein
MGAMGSGMKIWSLVVVLLCGLLWSGELFAITTAPYYPIVAGNSWTYNSSYFGTYTTTVLNGTVPVNGVATFVLQDSDDGLQSYITNDQNGIRLHRQFEPSGWIDGQWYASFDITYSPPIKMAEAEMTVGASLFSTGSAITTVSGLGTFYLTYSLTSSIDGLENVTVPAGTYQAVKITQSLTITGNIQGSYVYETSSSTTWLVKGLGEVKYSELDSDGLWQEVLIATNVAPKVTPTAGSNGTISPNTPQYVPDNETITFTVIPDPSYLIDSVTGCGGTLTGNSYTTAPVSEDCEVVATFYLLESRATSLPWLMLLLEDE